MDTIISSTETFLLILGLIQYTYSLLTRKPTKLYLHIPLQIQPKLCWPSLYGCGGGMTVFELVWVEEGHYPRWVLWLFLLQFAEFNHLLHEQKSLLCII